MLEIKDFVSRKAMYRYTLTFNKLDYLESFIDEVSILAKLIEVELPDASFDLNSVVHSFNNETDKTTNILGYLTLLNEMMSDDCNDRDEGIRCREIDRMEEYLNYITRYIKYLRFIGEIHSIEIVEIN